MICEYCNGLVHPVTIKEDEYDGATCDSCYSLATEVPGLGFVCVRSRKILVEKCKDGCDALLHPEDVSAWRRLKWLLYT
jgi:hypothetical protein